MSATEARAGPEPVAAEEGLAKALASERVRALEISALDGTALDDTAVDRPAPAETAVDGTGDEAALEDSGALDDVPADVLVGAALVAEEAAELAGEPPQAAQAASTAVPDAASMVRRESGRCTSDKGEPPWLQRRGHRPRRQ